MATEPLTDEEWRPMNPGTLYVLYNGDLLLIVERRGPKLVLDELEHEVLRTIRIAPHSVRLRDLARELGLTLGEVSQITEKLRNKGHIRQYSGDDVPPAYPYEHIYESNEETYFHRPAGLY